MARGKAESMTSWLEGREQGQVRPEKAEVVVDWASSSQGQWKGSHESNCIRETSDRSLDSEVVLVE